MSKYIKTLNLDEATLINVASSTVTYVGKATVGTLTSEAKWKISRLSSDVAGNVQIEFADVGNYNQIWDNRASLTYTT